MCVCVSYLTSLVNLRLRWSRATGRSRRAITGEPKSSCLPSTWLIVAPLKGWRCPRFSCVSRCVSCVRVGGCRCGGLIGGAVSSVTRLWMIEVERYACENVVKCLVGNKTDLAVTRVRARHTDTQTTRNSPHTTTRLRRHLVQAVTVEEAREVAASLNVSYFETSAKTGTLSHPPRASNTLAPVRAQAYSLRCVRVRWWAYRR
jgi:hypothetical protein